MKTQRIALALISLLAVLAAAVALNRPRRLPPNIEPLQPEVAFVATSTDVPPLPIISEAVLLPRSDALLASQPLAVESSMESPAQATNKLDRLAQIRATFRALAAGDKTNALRAAKQITDETERETALLTVVTEWTQGELGPPRLRAERIASLGLDAGLGCELGKHPELALLWADEMTEGAGRAAVLQQAAGFLVDSDPAAALALTLRLPETERRGFSDALFANWAQRDTDAAIKWAEQFPDVAKRDEAMDAIRSVAPVGIGTALRIQDGYPVINDLIPGTPAALGGQLQVGDRIVALAQGSGPFVEVYEAPLADIVQAVRGAPRTILQLKVMPAGASPSAMPRTVVILRDQIKFKK